MLTVSAEDGVAVSKRPKIAVFGGLAKGNVRHAEPGGELLEVGELVRASLLRVRVTVALAALDNLKVGGGGNQIAGRAKGVENLLETAGEESEEEPLFK